MLFQSYLFYEIQVCIEYFLREIHDDTHAVTTAQKGTRVSFKVPEKVRPSDKLFKIIKNNED